MGKVCRYVLEMRRSSDIEGVFYVSDDEWKMLQNISGSEIYYGEIAGKHSDVTCEFNIDEVEILSEDEKDCEVFNRLVGSAGFNFKDYWFNTESAYSDGYSEGDIDKDINLEELTEDTHYKGLFLEAYIEGFKDARKDRDDADSQS